MNEHSRYTDEELDEEFKKLWLALRALTDSKGSEQKNGWPRLLVSVATVIAGLGALFGPAIAVLVG